MEVKGPLVECKRGLHIMRESHLAYWPGWILFEVEAEGEMLDLEDKVVCRRARLVRRVETWTEAVLFAWLRDVVKRARDKATVPAAARAAAEAARAVDYAFITTVDYAANDVRCAAAWAVAAVDAHADAYGYARVDERAWQTEQMLKYIQPTGPLGFFSAEE